MKLLLCDRDLKGVSHGLRIKFDEKNHFLFPPYIRLCCRWRTCVSFQILGLPAVLNSPAKLQRSYSKINRNCINFTTISIDLFTLL